MISNPDLDDEVEINFKLNEENFTAPYFTFCSYSKKFRKGFNNQEYEVDSKVTTASFKTFLKACQGKFYLVDDCNFSDLLKLCIEFECDGIKKDVIKFVENRKKENIIVSYSSLFTNNSSGNSNHEAEVLANTIAQNLESYIDEESLLELNNDALSKILFNDKRSEKVTESQIFKLIKEKANKNKKDNTTELYSHLHIRELGEDDINDLLSLSVEQMPKTLDTECFWPYIVEIYKSYNDNKKQIDKLIEQLDNYNETWEKSIGPLQAKLDEYDNWKDEKEREYGKLDQKNKELDKLYRDLQEEYKTLNDKYEALSKKQGKNDEEYARRFPFKGIIFNYKKENANIKECIEVKTPTDDNTRKYDPYDLFEYDGAKINNCYYHNLKMFANNTDNWIDFNFIKTKFKLYGFSLRTSCFGQCFSHPKVFQIKGSNDGKKWDDIYQVDDSEDQFLNGSCLSHTYIFDKNEIAYKYIRFLQTDAHFQYKDRFGIIALSAIEFFGDEDNQSS